MQKITGQKFNQRAAWGRYQIGWAHLFFIYGRYAELQQKDYVVTFRLFTRNPLTMTEGS
jgi:hypothetical protein